MGGGGGRPPPPFCDETGGAVGNAWLLFGLYELWFWTLVWVFVWPNSRYGSWFITYSFNRVFSLSVCAYPPLAIRVLEPTDDWLYLLRLNEFVWCDEARRVVVVAGARWCWLWCWLLWWWWFELVDDWATVRRWKFGLSLNCRVAEKLVRGGEGTLLSEMNGWDSSTWLCVAVDTAGALGWWW